MKRVKLAAKIFSVLLLVSPISLFALQTTPPADVLIVELQVRSSATQNAANEEFVELFNTTDQPIDISTWHLEYKSATGSTWNQKAALHGLLGPGKRYLLASNDYLNDIALDHFSAGFSDSAGHIRLISPGADVANPIVHDQLGWGSAANAPEGEPASAPGGGKSLKRLLDSDGHFIDTDNNKDDFAVSDQPTPEVDALYEPEPEPTQPEEPVQTTTETTEPPAENSTSPQNLTTENAATPENSSLAQALQISELLPNPAPPASDSEAEYIELFNPNNEAVDLEGYKLQSGNSFSYSFTFINESIGANSYKAFYITDTGLILSNSAGKVRLLNPNAQVVAETDSYENAKDGEAWALSGNWQWTTTPTPDAANIITAVLAKETKAAAAAKPKTTKAAAAKKSTAKKLPTTKSTKSKAVVANERSSYEEPSGEGQIAPIHPAILAGVGGLALVYGLYEYRQDFKNRLYQLRRYRAARRAARQAA